MKKFIGLCILVILLVAASGCTQPAATTVPTPEPTPETTMPAATAAETQPPVTTMAPAEVTEEVPVDVTLTATPMPELTHSKTTVIYIRNNTFVPQEMLVLPGTGITWINEDRTVHKIQTLPDMGIKFVSGDVVHGASFGYTFSQKEGTYGYIDPYTNATGIIVVKKGLSVVGAPTQQKTAIPTATIA
jgi:plastocyanin